MYKTSNATLAAFLLYYDDKSYKKVERVRNRKSQGAYIYLFCFELNEKIQLALDIYMDRDRRISSEANIPVGVIEDYRKILLERLK